MIADPYCWHRPGRRIRFGVLCRHCGVLIEECPCVEWRKVRSDCPLCQGGGWVAVVRGRRAKFAELLAEDGPMASETLRCLNPDCPIGCPGEHAAPPAYWSMVEAHRRLYVEDFPERP